MRMLKPLFDNNEAWARQLSDRDPEFFSKLSKQQTPEYLWIGCADSRVPANQIVGLQPGEVFVHRNVANVVVHTDLNCLSVLQFAVEVLKVKHVMVVGHYDCGGVASVLDDRPHGLIDNWLRYVEEVRRKHQPRLEAIGDERARADRLCELNVIEQAVNVARTTVVQAAWRSGQQLTVHGWIYGLHDGLLRDLDACMTGADELIPVYEQALSALG